MKKFSIYLSFALAMGLWSCSSESTPDNVSNNSEGNVYASLALSFGNTRSTTQNPGENTPSQSSDGFEFGKDYENNVQSVLVVLAKKDETTGKFSYVTDSGICNAYDASQTPSDTKNHIYKLKFSTTALAEYADQEVYVFAYCNPSARLVEEVIGQGKWGVDLERTIADPDNAEIWSKNNFLMTNGMVSKTKLPSVYDMNNKFNHISKPCDLGRVLVERVCARFDFAQTSVQHEGKDLDPNVYPIYEYVADKDGQFGSGSMGLQGFVNIDAMALVNEATKFYYLSRVAPNEGQGQAAHPGTPITILGQETPNDWVISPAKTNADWFYSFIPNPEGKLPDPSSSLFKYTAIADLNEEDTDNDWNSEKKRYDYKIWRYTTENTIDLVSDQKYGSTTGVVFRGYLSAPEGTKLATAITSGKPIYSHEGIMYGNLDQLKVYVSKYPRSAVSIAWQAARDFTIDLTKYKTEADILKFLNEDPKANADFGSSDYFNVYTQTNGKYYTYYFYPNRHNDNGNNTVMGPMEFATVRNNVYKLRLTNIYRWGNPGDKPFDPENPDEDPEVYFRVEVEVLPWVVRINDIEF